jgi:two-component system cell cycle sensor histidine kinase/response regulator CckA
MPAAHTSRQDKVLVRDTPLPVACLAQLPEKKKVDNLWQLFAEGIPDILVQLSVDGTILHINRTPPGLTPDDVLGKNVFEFLLPASRTPVRRSLGEVFAGGESRVHEIPAVGDDGRICWFAAHIGPIIVGGRIAAAAVIARDITGQKAAELALRDSEARYRTLVENAPEAIVVLDVDSWRFVDVNANACLLFGLSREELLTREPLGLSPLTQPDGRPSSDTTRDFVRQALEGETPAFEWVHCSASGAAIRCEVRLVRLPAKGRRLVRGSIIDITTQQNLQRQLQQFQQLDTLGQMAGGIAHDFNNILTVIISSAEMLLLDLEPDSEMRMDAQTIRDASRRGAQLTKQILTFARGREPHREPLDLNGVVQHTIAMLRRLMGANVTLVQQPDSSGAMIFGDRGQVEQILVNLILNARDAVGGKGTVTVATQRLLDDSVALMVSDDGMGIPEGNRDKIFEAFFTTKPAGQGTGLGLATVNALVRCHGATITVTSRVGVGTTFEIVFPVAASTKPREIL